MQIYVKTIAIRSPTCMFVICQRPSTRNMTVSKERYHLVRSPSWYSNYCYTIFVSGEAVSSILKENFLFFSFLCDTHSKCRQGIMVIYTMTAYKISDNDNQFQSLNALGQFFFLHILYSIFYPFLVCIFIP